MGKVVEMTLTGCIDCSVVKALRKEDPEEIHVAFSYGGSAIRFWRDSDDKHTIIIVRGKPERMFCSCQPFQKLCSENGVAAILNFAENIKAEQEAGEYAIS